MRASYDQVKQHIFLQLERKNYTKEKNYNKKDMFIVILDIWDTDILGKTGKRSMK